MARHCWHRALVNKLSTTPRTVRARAVSRARSAGSVWLIRLAAVGVPLATWQAFGAWHVINPVLSGTPTLIVTTFLGYLRSPVVTFDLPYTLAEVAAGLLIGVALGIGTSLVLARYNVLRVALNPLVTALNSMPRIALAPLFVLWFGLGPGPRVAQAVSLVFFVMLLTSLAAFTQPDRDYELLAATLGATRRQYMRLFVFPNAIPAIAAGLELSLAVSFIGVIVGEMTSGQYGLGVLIVEDGTTFNTNGLFAVLLILLIVAGVSSILFHRLVARLTRWHQAETLERV